MRQGAEKEFVNFRSQCHDISDLRLPESIDHGAMAAKRMSWAAGRRLFPDFVICHAPAAAPSPKLGWLYARLTLSFRDVEKMLAERGLDVSYETVRRWFPRFGSTIAAKLRRTRPRPSDHWLLDEMVIVIQRKRTWFWRAGRSLRR